MKDPTQRLGRMVGGDVTDPFVLCQTFYRAHDPYARDPKPVKSTYLKVPAEVYDAVVRSHDEGLRLVDAIRAVMMDDEHALIFEEALALRHEMPNRFLFMEEVENYERALRRFDPYAMEQQAYGFIKVPRETAFEMNEMMKYHCFMVARIFDDCFNTDYMKQFGFYKDSGHPYQGPNALQGAVNVLVAMQRVMSEAGKQEKLGRQRPDWQTLIGDSPS